MAKAEDKTTMDQIILNQFDDDFAQFSNNPSLQAGLLYCYATLKIQQFWRNGRLKDLEAAFKKGAQAVTNTTGGHAEYAGRLNLLGVILINRYERVGSVNELQTAIQLSRWAVKFTPPNHPNLATYLNNLGNMLQRRFERTGGMEDLEEAIQVSRQAVNITPPDHPNLGGILNDLGIKLQRRFERTGGMEDLEEAIQVSRQAVNITPPNHPILAGALNNLGNMLQRRFERTGGMEDLEEAIQVSRQAVNIAPPNHPNLGGRLNNLGMKLQRRFERTGRMEDLEEAIQVSRQAVNITPPNYPDLEGRLNNLGIKLQRRFERTDSMKDLEEAIQVSRQAVNITQPNYPNLGGILNNLGNMLQRRFERTGRMEDLEEAIKISRQAVKITPPNHPNLGGILNDLGIKLERRFERTDRIEDLKEAIQVSRKVINITSLDHPNLGERLNNLGNKLQRRFERTGRMEDLEEAIQVSRQAVNITQPNHPDLGGRLDNLGNKLQRRFERTGGMEDLEEAIQISRQAVNITSPNYPNLAGGLNNLGLKLQRRFERTGRMEDLEEAIQVSRQAVNVTPPDHPDLAVYLNNLGNKLLQSQLSENEEALQRFRQAWNCTNSIPFSRLAAATNAIGLLKQGAQWDLAAQLAIDVALLLPLVNNRSLGRDDQRHVVSQFFGIASDVGALVLQSGGDAFTALELLELTRGSIIGLLIDDRSDISELRQSSPELAAEYERLRTEVNTPVHETEDPHVLGLRTTRRLEAVRDLDRCIYRIRDVPGNQRFLLGPSPKELQDQASEGPIVVVNVNSIRSDAIIVTTTEIQSISLADLTLLETTDWLGEGLNVFTSQDTLEDWGKKNKRYIQFLHWLWEKCVRQVLLAVFHSANPTSGSLPRIWWIGIGIAASLPFHAAGDHSVGSTDNTLSRAISSYTPTIKTLAHARRRQSTLQRDRSDRKSKSHLLMVSMPTTPGRRALPGVTQEMSAVQTATGLTFSHESLVHADAQSVLDKIRDCDIVHFACHGMSDDRDPFNSCLVLQHGPSETATVDPLSVRQVSDTNLGRASIAYLSACSTAENRVTRMTDEGIHLASGFQVAGFGHVVATMWPSNDEECVDMAAGFYGQLKGGLGGRDTDRAVAVAVHAATMSVRSRRRRVPLSWAPYIHFGA